MTEGSSSSAGPDLTQAVPLASIVDGEIVTGHVDGEPALLVHQGGRLFAIGAMCTHYGAPLADGLLVGDTIRCPWHHACFDLRTGEVVRAPALEDLKCWRVERHNDRAFVREELPRPLPPKLTTAELPKSAVIIGGGAAGNAAVEMLRREGYQDPVTMLSADPSLPYDRPNLSKDYLAGTAKAEWIPLRSSKFYADHHIDVRCGTRVIKLDPAQRAVSF
jgi:nitrite reductase/ring-hydroxylating ferredoxin subunit